MRLSIVTTLFQSAHYIIEFHQRASAVAKQLVDEDYEIILVNDGSLDDSLDIAVKLTESDSHVVVVDLSRNFGHHKAMMTGLTYTKGQNVFLIDSDLEEEPEWLISFAKRMETEASDVVYGIQSMRRGGFLEQITGRFFYKAFRLLTGIEQPNNIITARLMSRRYVNALLLHRESELNIGGLWIVTGFKQCHESVQKHYNSKTTYSLSQKFNHFINAVTSFSNIPLVFIFYTGLFISASALAYIVFLTIRYFFLAAPPDGYTSILVSIWFFSGLIVFFIGLQGIYISKIFSEVKQRPYTIIRHVYNDNSERV